MVEKDFVVSADGHLLEPIDLFKTRLPENLRDMAVWEEEIEIEPFVEGGARVFRKLHTPGFEGWTVSRYRQTSGRTPEGDPEIILEDMDVDGVDAQVLHPNLSQFGLFTDHHEMSIAHARVYNDYVMERFTPYFDRLAPTAPIPLTDIGDAVVEVERVAAGGFKAVLLPATAPSALLPADYDPVWAGDPGHRHERLRPHPDRRHQDQRSGGAHAEGHAGERPAGQPADDRRRWRPSGWSRRRSCSRSSPRQLICQLIGGGVPERFPDLHFSLIEFNAYWLSSLVGSMDKCWITGIGQDPDWWIGVWDDTRPDDDQPGMAQLFRLNEKWPYPLMPSEYVQRQFHVSFQDDPVAVACRHITGLSTVMWGNDYPHAEGTFRGSQELLRSLMAGVPDDERKAMVGGTLGDLLGLQPAPAAGSTPA